MANAYGYLRVSTEGQAQEGVSLEAQESRIKAWCELNGYVLAGLHIDAGLSGKNMNRPGLQKALSECRHGDAFIVYSLSRLTRSTKDALQISEQLEKSGVDLISLNEHIDTTTPFGKAFYRIIAALNELERDQLSERTKEALAYKKAQGERLGAPKYGYQVIDGQLVEVESEQEIIAAIHSYRDGGLSLRTIVKRLKEQGYKSRTGKPFQLTQVARIANG
jgi:DNA invertase Pin-like site-specific DNA recombinase